MNPRSHLRSLRRFRFAFTLVELLVVISIIGVVVGMTLPAIQAAREAARRLYCKNNLKQMGLALTQHMDAMRRLPSGNQTRDLGGSQRFFWSGQILPYMEQTNVYIGLVADGPWDDPTTNNGKAQTLTNTIFRCPSAAPPDRYDHVIVGRVPATYLACASGLVDRESGPGKQLSATDLDGAFYTNSRHRDRDFLDGLSNSLWVSESLFLENRVGPDHDGHPQIVDHWAIGSGGMFPNEMSEAIGTTAIPPNSWMNKNAFIEHLELGYGSRHGGLVVALFGDGRVQSISSSISMQAWSAAGTIAEADLYIPED